MQRLAGLASSYSCHDGTAVQFNLASRHSGSLWRESKKSSLRGRDEHFVDEGVFHAAKLGSEKNRKRADATNPLTRVSFAL